MMMVAVKGWRLRWALAFSCTSPPPHHRPPVSLEFETLVLVFISNICRLHNLQPMPGVSQQYVDPSRTRDPVCNSRRQPQSPLQGELLQLPIRCETTGMMTRKIRTIMRWTRKRFGRKRECLKAYLVPGTLCRLGPLASLSQKHSGSYAKSRDGWIEHK